MRLPDALRRSFPVDRIDHPRLVGTTAFGVALLVVGAAIASWDPTLGFRVGFVGAVVALFGASGYVAFLVLGRNAGPPGPS